MLTTEAVGLFDTKATKTMQKVRCHDALCEPRVGGMKKSEVIMVSCLLVNFLKRA